MMMRQKRTQQNVLEERAASQEERRELVAIVMEGKEDTVQPESIQRRVRREAQKLRAMLIHTAEKYPDEAADIIKGLHQDQRIVAPLEAVGSSEKGGRNSMVVDNIKIAIQQLDGRRDGDARRYCRCSQGRRVNARRYMSRGEVHEVGSANVPWLLLRRHQVQMRWTNVDVSEDEAGAGGTARR